MDLATRQRTVRQIISGTLLYTDPDGRRLKIWSLDEDDLLEAEDVYYRAYGNALFEGVMDDTQYMEMLLENEMWDEEKEKNLNDVLPKHVEEFCVQIYQSVFKSETRERTRKYLARAREEISSLTQQRYAFSYMTAAGIASFARTLFVVERGLEKFDPGYTPNVHHALNFFLSQQLSDEDLRYLARKSPWSDIWSSAKRSGVPLFKGTGGDLTPDQQRLVLWSSMYDNIRECPDSPDDSVFDDDDAMDGWLIIQRRKSKKAKLESEADKYVKNPNAGEVFVVAETPEDIKRIKELNSEYGKATMKARFAKMKEKGTAKDTDFADVRQRLTTEATNRFIGSQKRR